eukprot:g1276.t1
MRCGQILDDIDRDIMHRLRHGFDHEHGHQCWCELMHRVRCGQILDSSGSVIVHRLPCAVGNREGCGKATAGFCSACYPGRYSDVENKKCVDCPAQYLQVGKDQPNCTRCPDGKYQNEAGSVYCKDTPSGRATRIVMRTSADGSQYESYEELTCPTGKFSPASSAQGCEYCAQGKVQPEPGKAQCEQCSSKQYIKTDVTSGRSDNRTCLSCPPLGVLCDGEARRYVGSYWHDPAVVNPDESTRMYACITDGCPDEGETTMGCKEGYGGPLCAVCDDHYMRQVKKCVECGKPLWGYLMLFIAGVALVGVFVWRMLVRYALFLKHMTCFAHFKIFVSFVTVMSTVSTQFGVVWPSSFARALDGLSVLSFDFGVMAALLCIADLNFYHSLLCSTLALFAVVAGILLFTRLRIAFGQCQPPNGWKQGLFAAVYVLLFAYPVVSVKVVRAFACHDVDFLATGASLTSDAATNTSSVVPDAATMTRSYLRADYSLECYTSEWNAMAFYAGAWILVYVILFPLYVTRDLLLQWRLHSPAQQPEWLEMLFRRVISKHQLGAKPTLGFLADDYKPDQPMALWEALEMARKLLLSVIGAFWSTQSTMCVATALLISLCFQLLQSHYSPFKAHTLNTLQQLSLTVLSLTYFIGLLLKTQSVDADDEENVGTLLVLLLAAVFTASVTALVLEARNVSSWAREGARRFHAFRILFHGTVRGEVGVPCIASFPGKFELSWKEVVLLGRNESLSVACVFLPKHTPSFGQHQTDPEATEGRCYCHAIYGEPKPWGCVWFEVWKRNCRHAHALGQVMKVYFFPGQVSQGKIRWEDCAAHSLLRDKVMSEWPKDSAGWPKTLSREEETAYLQGLPEEERHCMVGLGGSQKAEVAWLDKEGIPYEELDVRTFGLHFMHESVQAQSQKFARRIKSAGTAGTNTFANPMFNEAREQKPVTSDDGWNQARIRGSVASTDMDEKPRSLSQNMNYPEEMGPDASSTAFASGNPIHSQELPTQDIVASTEEGGKLRALSTSAGSKEWV